MRVETHTAKGTPSCLAKTQKKAWRNPLAPAAQCKKAAERGFCTCRQHRRSESDCAEVLRGLPEVQRAHYGRVDSLEGKP